MECDLCPRRCKVDREKGEKGFCRASNFPKVALVSLHKWEEPCLVGENGAGTVFFSNCNLKCVFCQNYEISSQGKGKEITVERLAEIFLKQQERNAACLDLVTPTPYLKSILPALDIAKKNGLKIPVVYNTNAYVSKETIKYCQGYIDVFLPDLKYYSDEYAIKYSNAPNYFQVATLAIKEMFKLVGKPVLENGLLKKGILVRHLVLPWLYKDSIKILEYLANEYADDIYLSIMNQYTPVYLAKDIKKLNRKLTTFEYEKVLDCALKLGFKNCFIQEKSAAKESFIPSFDGTNV